MSKKDEKSVADKETSIDIFILDEQMNISILTDYGKKGRFVLNQQVDVGQHRIMKMPSIEDWQAS